MKLDLAGLEGNAEKNLHHLYQLIDFIVELLILTHGYANELFILLRSAEMTSSSQSIFSLPPFTMLIKCPTYNGFQLNKIYAVNTLKTWTLIILLRSVQMTISTFSFKWKIDRFWSSEWRRIITLWTHSGGKIADSLIHDLNMKS